MVKTIEDATENYLQSIPKAMQNYKKFLIRDKKIVKTTALAKQTTDYGIQMLHAGVGTIMTPEEAAEIFREQADICNSLEMYCREYL